MHTVHPITLSIPASLQYLNVISEVIAALLAHAKLPVNPDDNPVYNVQLAVHEVCTNVIEHAYGMDMGKQVTLIFRLDDVSSCLNIVISDESGVQFDATTVDEPVAGVLQERGMGLFLVHQLMDEVQYQHQNGKNTWTLNKSW